MKYSEEDSYPDVKPESVAPLNQMPPPRGTLQPLVIGYLCPGEGTGIGKGDPTAWTSPFLSKGANAYKDASEETNLHGS